MSTRSTVTTRSLGGATVVELAGEFDIADVPELETHLLDPGDGDVVIDLSAATFIDSAVLAVILRRHQRAGTTTVVVAPAGSFPRRALELMGLAGDLDLAETAEQAVAGRER